MALIAAVLVFATPSRDVIAEIHVYGVKEENISANGDSCDIVIVKLAPNIEYHIE